MNSNIREVLEHKGAEVHTVPLGTLVKAAAVKMRELQIGSLLVMNEQMPVGILTERDLARKVVYEGLGPDTTRVEEVMTSPLAFVDPGCSVQHAMKVMSHTHCRHLPVFSDATLVGLVSLGDLIRWRSADLKAHVRFLESYIRGI